MRLLLLFTLGFGAVCLFGSYTAASISLYIVFAFVAITAICWRVLKWSSGYPHPAVVVLIGITVGFCWWMGFDALRMQSVREIDGEIAACEITLSDYSTPTAYGVMCDGQIRINGKEFRVRAYINGQEDQLNPGDRIDGNFRLRTTVGREGTYHSGNGIYLLAYSNGDYCVQRCQQLRLRYFPAYCRNALTREIDLIFPNDTRAFAKALLIGDTSNIDYETDAALKISGIRHIIAVSGLHVTMLFGALYIFGGKMDVRMVLAGIFLLFLYAAIVGFSASIVRACIMLGLLSVSRITDNEYDPITALAFSALVQMLTNPLVVTSAGFQLSYASVIGIFAFAGRIRRWLFDEKRFGKAKGKTLRGKLQRFIVMTISVSVSANVLTIPLSAFYFGTVSIAGVITNLLIIWIVSFTFCGIILACIAGAISIPFGTAAAWLCSWMVRYILFIAKLIAKFPLAAVYTSEKPVIIWLVFCYALLAAYLVAGKHLKKLPYLEAAAAGLGIAIAIVYLSVPSGTAKVAVLDVGQGQCIVLHSEGKTYLVDCGGDTPEIAADKAADYLLSHGISRLDGVILTHGDYDHAAGLELLLTRLDCERLYLQNPISPEKYETRMICVDTVYKLSFGNSRLTLFPGADTGKANDASMCILFQTENCDILITGDRSGIGELELLQQMDPCELEVLIVGHHGARDSTCETLLRELQPEIALISVGADNSYGHPSAEVLERLESYGCTVHRTDLEGTIIYGG